MKNKYALLIGVFLLIVFFIFSRQVKKGFLKQTDFAFTVKLQERIDSSSKLRLKVLIGDVMEGSTFFASPEFSIIIIGVLTLVSTYNWKKKKIIWSSLCIPVFFGLLILGEIYGKNVVHHPSPPFFMIKNPTTIFPKYYINESFSYPSGHAARAIFLCMAFYSVIILQKTYLKRKFQKIALISILCGYTILVSLSRIYLGHHWLSDILGGGLLGLGFGLLTLAVNSLIIDKQ